MDKICKYRKKEKKFLYTIPKNALSPTYLKYNTPLKKKKDCCVKAYKKVLERKFSSNVPPRAINSMMRKIIMVKKVIHRREREREQNTEVEWSNEHDVYLNHYMTVPLSPFFMLSLPYAN